MEWLFERTIEAAAWVAFIFCVVFSIDGIWSFALWAMSLGKDGGHLSHAAYAARGFIGAALAVGVLACIDRYVFDLPADE